MNIEKILVTNLQKKVMILGDIVVPVPDSGVPAAIGYSQYKKKGLNLD